MSIGTDCECDVPQARAPVSRSHDVYRPSAPTHLSVAADQQERRNGLQSVQLSERDVSPDGALRVVRDRSNGSDKEEFISFGDIDADAACLCLADTPASIIIHDGQTRVIPPRNALHTTVEDLRPSLHWKADHPLDVLSFIVPRAALDRWAEETGAGHFGGLHHQIAQRSSDEVIAGFGLAILPCLERPDEAPRLFVDQVLYAVCGYLARTFGFFHEPAQHKGGLAPWQERRAKEMISANLDNQLSLRALAAECRLSISHFTKAFKTSVGQSPHQWLIERRVEQAQTLLITTDRSLSEIAMTCGFADQSHFSRAFAKRAGWSPGAWRRAHTECVSA